MNVLIIYLIKFFFHFSAKNSSDSINDRLLNSDCFRIVKIDSITETTKIHGDHSNKKYEGVYILYAERKGNLYKIVSERHTPVHCKRVKINGCYFLNLKGVFAQNNGEPADLSIAQAEMIIINGASVKREKEMMNDVFYDERLKNLCLGEGSKGK